MATKLVQLHDAIAAVCPIDGISTGVWTDKTTWRVDYQASATDAQKQAAQTVVTNFDINTADIPDVVDMMQAQLALQNAGLLTQVNTLIANSNNAQWQLIWSKAITLRRDSAMLNQIAAALSPPLTKAQVDQLFIAAAAIAP